MAGLEDLAAFLVANQGVRQQIAQESPYAAPSQQFEGLAGQALGARDYSTRDRVAGAAISGLLSGIFGGMDQSYQNRALDAYGNAITSAKTGAQMSRPEVLTPSLFDQATQQGRLFRELRQLQLEDADRDFKNEIKKVGITEAMKNRRDADRILGLVGELTGDAKPMADAEPSAAINEAPIASKAKSGAGRRIESRIMELANEFQDSADATPGQALETATKVVQADLDALKTARQRIDELRQQARDAERLANDADVAVSGAGETGGFGGGARDVASRLYALISPEEQQQRASEKLIEGLGSEIVKAARPTGAGAMSDRDLELYLSGGVSTGNTPEQNKAIIGKLRNVTSLNREYADFLEQYINDNGTTDGAEQVWDFYRTNNPLVVDVDGKKELNQERIGWREYFAKVRSGEAPMQQEVEKESKIDGGTGGVPAGYKPTGRTSKGRPVYQNADGKLWVP